MKNIICTMFFGMLTYTFFAQELEVGIEFRPRYEFRNGFGTLLDDTQDPTSFVSQRSRLNLNFNYENLTIVLRPQDIRVWGDVATNQSNAHDGLALFEGYAQYRLDNIWKFKVGRQTLSYDNQRILGEVNWAQQGRSHDAFLVSVTPNKKHRLDVGASVSSNAETVERTAYSVNNYKNMQLLWYQYGFKTSTLSVLFLNTGYEFETTNQDLKTQYAQTFGMFYSLKTNKWIGEFSVYGQTGTRNDTTVSAWYGGASLGYLATEHWLFGIGGEYLSGTAMDDTSGTNKSFTPLFGTNHKFNGLMDYFYVGNHANSVGLIDAYAQLKYSKNKLTLTLLPHVFSSAESVLSGSNTMDSYLGTVIDVVVTYKLHKFITANLGYSQIFATDTMEVLKGGNANRTHNWAWAMVTVRPEIFSFKK
ncbi:alginate export family protein [Gaetbulibacter sp. PBL-D1]|uniref:alginate export family protein n=1 Tax=Gaetbulibacter sp. PBL-D1 TaxID=3422594 RepID=UPI003D2EDC84